ncbi:MAG: hypothetical protein V1738_01210 [Patescibacteria group bacterium]
MPSKKRKKSQHRPAEVTRIEPQELEAVRAQDLSSGTENTRPNIFIGTVNIVMGPMKSFIDPVKKVCYPQLEAHWENKYRSRFPKHAGKLLVFDLALLFLASTLAVSLVLVHTVLPPVRVAESVAVAIDQPVAMNSGELSVLNISYASGADELVRDAELIVESGADMLLVDGNGDISTQQTFDLGDLPPHNQGSLAVSAYAYGAVGTTLPVLVKLSYWETGRANRTVVSTYYELPLESAPLNLVVEFDEPMMTNSISTMRIDYENVSEETLRDVHLQLDKPLGYRLTGATPAVSRNGDWSIGNLEPGAHGSIAVHGILRDGATPSFSVSGTIEAVDGMQRVVSATHLNTDAISTGFELTHNVSGLSSLWPGQTTEVTIKYANTGERTLKNLTVTLNAEGAYLLDEANFPLVWTAADDSALTEIAPGEFGTLTAPVRLAPVKTQDELNGAENQTVRINATAEYELADSMTRIFHAESEVSDLPVSTMINVDAAALYFTQAGDQLGIGPIPPQVEKTTRYWLVLSIKNGPNALRKARLTATLLPAAEWSDEISVAAGRPLAFIASDRKIIWNIGDIPAFAGEHLSSATANFEIEVRPDHNDVGQVLDLLDHIYIEGEDVFTGTKVTASAATVTTAVRFGTPEAMSGVVVE